MSVQLSILASSSAGNAALIASSKTKILIDCGINRKKMWEGLAAAGVRPSELSGICLSHSHGDHVAGLEAVTANLSLPVYLTRETSAEIAWSGRPPVREYFEPYQAFMIGDICCLPFPLEHDAPNCGFRFIVDGVTIAWATDLGNLPVETAGFLSGADVLMIESNHDISMLEHSSHPLPVRQRISSKLGHLSNDDVAEFIRTSLDDRTSALILGHLSTTNNHPAIAEGFAAAALAERGLSPTLLVANTREPSPTVML